VDSNLLAVGIAAAGGVVVLAVHVDNLSAVVVEPAVFVILVGVGAGGVVSAADAAGTVHSEYIAFLFR
jgi:hypothetical protein